jgi:signal peptidase
MSRFQRLTSVATTMLCVLVTLGALAFIVPAALGLQRYVIAGSSMTGTIDLGSVAFEEVVPVDDLRVGDIITYVPPADSGVDNLVTHRIVSLDGDELRTKGDANADVDPWKFQLTAATQPRVVFSVPYVGYPLLWLQDRGTRMLVIGVPAGLVFLLALGELLGGLRRRPDDADAPADDQAEEQARTGAVHPLPEGGVRKVLVGTVPDQPGPQQAGAPRPRRRSRQVQEPTR